MLTCMKRISGLIYKETCRVLDVFLEEVIQDVVTYTEYANPDTVTVIDALERHSRTLYHPE